MGGTTHAHTKNTHHVCHTREGDGEHSKRAPAQRSYLLAISIHLHTYQMNTKTYFFRAGTRNSWWALRGCRPPPKNKICKRRTSAVIHKFLMNFERAPTRALHSPQRPLSNEPPLDFNRPRLLEKKKYSMPFRDTPVTGIPCFF